MEAGVYVIKDKAFDSIRDSELIKTSSEHFFNVLNEGGVPTNVFLRRAHNYAMGMHWLPWPVLPKLHWPPLKFKEKRAITFAEHQEIINREHNPATRAYYQLLWHLGGSQTDVAILTAEDVNWNDHSSLNFYRQASRLDQFFLAFIESKKNIRIKFHGRCDMKQIAATTAEIVGMGRPQLFGFAQPGDPVQRCVNQQGFVVQVCIHLPELDFALGQINQFMKHRQPDGIAHFKSVPRRECYWLAVTLHECGGRD